MSTILTDITQTLALHLGESGFFNSYRAPTRAFEVGTPIPVGDRLDQLQVGHVYQTMWLVHSQNLARSIDDVTSIVVAESDAWSKRGTAMDGIMGVWTAPGQEYCLMGVVSTAPIVHHELVGMGPAILLCGNSNIVSDEGVGDAFIGMGYLDAKHQHLYQPILQLLHHMIVDREFARNLMETHPDCLEEEGEDDGVAVLRYFQHLEQMLDEDEQNGDLMRTVQSMLDKHLIEQNLLDQDLDGGRMARKNKI